MVLKRQTTLKEPAAEISANLEYPVCPLCESNRRELSFRLHEPYRVARCVECGLHYLYPRLTEAAMHEVYRQPSYYEGSACGYADTGYTAQQSALRATFESLLHNVLRRGSNCGQFP
jgi:hypothetical protein